MTVRRFAGTVTALVAVLALASPAAADARAAQKVKIEPYRIAPSALAELKQRHLAQLRSRGSGWQELRFNLSNRDLRLLGLPPKRFLLGKRFSTPTMIDRQGNRTAVALPTVATYAGAGFFGIRPGALLLTITDNAIGWCTTAHVYGSPGSYSISTAGHCGKVGDKGTVIAAFGNRAGTLNPIVLDFGTYKVSHDNGLGDDYALISVDAPYQSLVTPTMAFWGGPRGVFTKTGTPVGVTIPRNGLIPTVTVNPDPFLAQQLVHYGHGTGVGFPAGTPRSATALHWGATHFMFFGAISPGDSGSASNTLLGDTVGANMEAAGINTHLYVDPLMRQGLGIMGGTRVTAVGTPANGQIVPVPAPAPVVP
ncbi:MAG TPA: hypothetical protein VGW75_12025 [Solirubrobacteraceae bacterium]|nr:hypothetical protein [Solirubrobacteraceae bacterium]